MRSDTLAFYGAGRYLVSTTSDSTGVVWDLGKGQLLRTMPGPAFSLAVSPDEKTLAVGRMLSNDTLSPRRPKPLGPSSISSRERPTPYQSLASRPTVGRS